MKFWKEGNINELLEEKRTMQEGLPSNITPMKIEKIASKFKQLTEKGNVNGALRLLTNNMSNRILPLSNKPLQLLHLKHLEKQEARNQALFQGPIKQVHSIVYTYTDEALVNKAAIKTKSGCGPSGFDADNWHRILVSKSFGSC